MVFKDIGLLDRIRSFKRILDNTINYGLRLQRIRIIVVSRTLDVQKDRSSKDTDDSINYGFKVFQDTGSYGHFQKSGLVLRNLL